MARITEDYCSKEIYRLLIKKGFDGEIHTSYDEEGYTQPSITLQMAMKWLREVHDIYIDISIYVITKNMLKYNINVYYKKNENDSMYLGIHLTKECSKYEEAVETAIKYCLKNLI